MGARVILAVLVCGVLTTQVAPAMAQGTPAEACAADSLYLVSPQSLDLRLESTGKRGLMISWPNLDLGEATCFSLKDIDDLAFDVTIDGGYGDKVDRIFQFSTPDAGAIGSADDGNITLTWLSQGQGANGNIGGNINLANNGGVLSYVAGAWTQMNNGLPMTLLRTNVVAMDRGTGDFVLASVTGEEAIETGFIGLLMYNGTNWSRLAAETLTDEMLITSIAISPGSNEVFAVGTAERGLFVTIDGGDTFTQWGAQLPSEVAVMPTVFKVSALNWASDRLLVAMQGWGLFISDNEGQTFRYSELLVVEDLDAGGPAESLPVINDFSVIAGSPDHIIAGLLFHGTFESTDGGVTWHDLYGTLLVADELFPNTWRHSANDVLIDAANPLIMMMGVTQKGLYRTADGGATWDVVGQYNAAGDTIQPANIAQLIDFSLINRRGMAGEMLVLENGWKLLQSLDSGATWDEFAMQPKLNKGLELVSRRDDSGDFMIGSLGGGIYVPGTTLELRDTYSTSTSDHLRDLDLGLTIWFGPGGVVNNNDEFALVAQTFQGWAVFRGAAHDPDEMKLVGLFDLVNPEDCFRGFCGDNSLEIVPQCFAAKRAACFDMSDSDTLRFFDDEVYNGFSYVYSVASFDYGNTALITPQNNKNEMLFSPRWAQDSLSRFSGGGNRTLIDVNEPAAAAVHDNEIYAYPNPIRLGAGVPRGEGSIVVFTNLPEGSRVRIFTTAGDDVINLGPDNQTGAQIYWKSNNRDGETVSAGVYLYKVEMPEREDYWGRIVVIR